MKIQINIKLALLLFTTKKQFLLYNLDKTESRIAEYRLTNDYILTGNNRAYSSYKVISCIKKQLTYINF
jgi:uncharacterized membrane protein YsdA (DUF1294 family)